MEDTKRCTKKATRLLIRLILKTPVCTAVKSNSESEQATTSVHQGAVVQPVADGKTCPSLQGGIPRGSPQHCLSSGANKASSERQDKQMEARAQIAAPSKNGEAKARKKTPDNSESSVQSRGASPETHSATFNNPGGSNAQNTNAKTRNSPSSKHMVTSKLNANAGLVEQQTVADSSVGLVPRGGVSWDGINWVPIEPVVMTNTIAMSEPQLNATMSQRVADRYLSRKNTSSGWSVKLPLLLTNKSGLSLEVIPPLIQAVTFTNLLPTQNCQLCVKTSAKVVKEHEAVTNALPFQDSLPNAKPSAKATIAPIIKPLFIHNNQPRVEPSVKETEAPVIKPLTIQDILPSVKPSAKATKAQNIMRVTCIPEVTGVGPLITTTPMFSLSEASPSKGGKVQNFLNTNLGKQEDYDILPIAKGSYSGFEQGRSKDYSRRASLSSNISHRLNQFRTDSEKLNSKEVTKRRRTIQHRPNQQMPELEQFKPRSITRRKHTICDHVQEMPNHQIPVPDKVPPLKLKAIPRPKGSILYEENMKENLHHRMPVSTMKIEDLGEFLDLLGISHVEDLETVVSDEPLTDSECDVFKEVFAKFAKNSNGCIDAKSLTCTLDRVEVCISPEAVQKAMQAADYDEDGEVGFQDFLHVMTDSQLFSKCVKAEGMDSSQFVELWERVFYKALNQMLETGFLSSSTTEELVQYYHRKTLGLIRSSVRPDEQEDGRIINYYAKGAHLIGLKRKQLLKYIQPLPQIAHEMIAQNQNKTSPYSKRPSLYMAYNSSDPQRTFLRVKKDHIKSAKTLKTTEIMDCFLQLPVNHTGMEAKMMITPVKIKVNMTIKERNQLTYNEINKITQKSKSGLKGYLEALTRLKRRDARTFWVSLQYLVQNQKDFFQTFTTYSWSWSGCCNMTGIRDLDAIYRSSPCLSCSQPPEPTDVKQLISSNQCG